MVIEELRRTRTILTMKRILAIISALLATSATGVLVWVLPGQPDPDLEVDMTGWESQFDACLAVSQDGRASECLRNLSEAAGMRGSIGAGLAILRNGIEVSENLVGKCHDAAHILGRRSIELGATLVQAHAVDFPDCVMGFHHGALEAYVETVSNEDLVSDLDVLCGAFGETPASYAECMHVLGHVLLKQQNANVRGAITLCTNVGASRYVARCVDGVFMQATEDVRDAVGDESHPRRDLLDATWGSSRLEQQRRAVSYCPADVLRAVSEACQTAVTKTLVVLWDNDWEALHGFCEQRNQDMRRPCFEGIAAGSFETLDWNIDAIADACHAGESDDTKHCMASLAYTIGLQGSAAQQARVCRLAREYEARLCSEQLSEGSTMRGSLSRESARRRDEAHTIYSQ